MGTFQIQRHSHVLAPVERYKLERSPEKNNNSCVASPEVV